MTVSRPKVKLRVTLDRRVLVVLTSRSRVITRSLLLIRRVWCLLSLLKIVRITLLANYSILVSRAILPWSTLTRYRPRPLRTISRSLLFLLIDLRSELRYIERLLLLRLISVIPQLKKSRVMRKRRVFLTRLPAISAQRPWSSLARVQTSRACLLEIRSCRLVVIAVQVS